MIRLVPAFGIPLVLAAGFGQGDTPLPATSIQAPLQRSPRPAPRILRRPNPAPPRLALPYLQSPGAPGDVMPHSYLIYGLRTGPGGMACTDRNGQVVPIPFNPQIVLGPQQYSADPFPPPTLILPRTFTLPRAFTLPPHAPKK